MRPTIDRQSRQLSRLLDELLDVNRGYRLKTLEKPGNVSCSLAAIHSIVWTLSSWRCWIEHPKAPHHRSQPARDGQTGSPNMQALSPALRCRLISRPMLWLTFRLTAPVKIGARASAATSGTTWPFRNLELAAAPLRVVPGGVECCLQLRLFCPRAPTSNRSCSLTSDAT